MMPITTKDIFDLLDGYLAAAALGAALESHLFWRLAEQPQTAPNIAQLLNIPPHRCRYWLEFLTGLGLLERQDDAYTLSATMRAAIIDAYSPETWALLAQYAREQYLAGNDLALHFGHPGSVWAAQDRVQPDYVAQMVASSERARRFTRMLYEIHGPLANELAEILDLSGARRLMDLGGGSGVVSQALLQRYPNLTAVVVDIANVCVAGREIVADTPLAERLTYHAADFLKDELPGGFDLALKCDVSIYDETLFRKMWGALNPGGRLVLVDRLTSPERALPFGYIKDAFYASLNDPEYSMPSVSRLQSLLARIGFQPTSAQVLSGGRVVIQAQR